MAPLLMFLQAAMRRGVTERVVPGMGRPGIGLALAALLSLCFALVSQAQTDGGSGDTPTLTIASSHAVVKKGEAVIFTITASRAPSADLLVTLRITAKSDALDETATARIPLAAGESATWLTLETAGGSVDLLNATLTVSIQAGAGYALGNPAAASARVSATDPPAGAAVAQQVLGDAPAPSGVTATGASTTSIRVSWNRVSLATAYRVEQYNTDIPFVHYWFTVKSGITTTSYTVTSLVCNTTYQFRVSARGDGGLYSTSYGSTTQTSGTTHKCVSTPPPLPVPSNVRVVGSNYTTIVVQWNAVASSNVKSIRLEKSRTNSSNDSSWSTADTVSGSSTSASATGLTCNTLYYLRVRAIGNDGTVGTASGSVSGRTILCPPPAPSGFSGTGEYPPPKVSASWTALSGASSYNFGVQIGPHWHSHSVGSKTNASHSTGLAAGRTYNIRVQACGDGTTYSTDCGAFETDRVTIPTPTPTPTDPPPLSDPPKPTGISTSATTSSISVSWTDQNGIDDYQLQIDDGGWTTVSDTGASGTAKNLTPATEYDLRLRGYGDGSAYKAVWSTYATFSKTTASPTPTPTPKPGLSPPPAPSNVRASITVGTGANTYGVELLWDLLPGAASFKVERSDDNGTTWPQPGHSGYNGHVTTGITGTQHSVTGLVCDNDYVFRISAYGDGSRYQAVYGPTTLVTRYGQIAGASAGGNFQCTKPVVSIVPLPQRKALLSWDDIADAKRYVVQAIKFTGSETISNLSTPAPLATGTGTSYKIEHLDNIHGGEGLAHLNAGEGFKFRVTVEFNSTSKAPQHSEVIIVAGPTIAINGDSPARNTSNDNGKMVVRWKQPSANAQYTIRYRKLPGDHGQAAIGGTPGWQPTPATNANEYKTVPNVTPTVVSTSGTPPVTVLEYPITGLNQGEIYAVQLNYTIANSAGGTDSYFSAREMYVWPSDDQPDAGDRVATYPFSGYFPSRNYTYRVCKSTFPGDQDAWAQLIEDALEQWERATGGLITMTPDHTHPSTWMQPGIPDYEPCTDYATPTPGPGTPTPTPTSAVAMIDEDWFKLIVSEDNGLNEIRTVDPPSFLKIQAGSFFELIVVADPLKACILLPGVTACVTSSPHYGSALQNISATDFYSYIIPAYGRLPLAAASTKLASADIIFNRDVLVPPMPTPSVAPNIPSRVVFNTCVKGSMPPMPDPNDSASGEYFLAYATAVHEAGHALGLAGRPPVNEILALIFVPYEVAHPTTPSAVMNYDQNTTVFEPDCAPHPLDILAIYALYQSAPPP